MTRRRWWLLAALVVVVWLAACGVLLVRAALDLRSGRTLARDARADLDAEAIAEGAALPDLRDAADRFSSAADATGNPILAPMKVLPVVGRQVRSVHALADAAAEVVDAGADALARAKTALAGDAGEPTARLAQVRELTAAVRTASRRVNAVDDLGPRHGLVGPVRDAHDELAEELNEARTALSDAAAGATVGLQLLTGPRRYLLVAANPAEARGGSGMWLSGGVLTSEQGRFRLDDVEPLYRTADPPDDDSLPIGDPDIAALWGGLWHPNWDWRGLMISPRLPASAELGKRMWETAGQEPVDGLLVVDPVALAAVVRAVGPVEAAGRTIGPDDVVPFLMNGQYRAAAGEERRDALGAIARATFDALDERQWSLTTLAEELRRAIRGRHLMAWSDDPDEQRAWVTAGMGGDIGSRSMLVSILNRGGNKLDWFLRSSATLSSSPAPDGGRRVELRLQVRNTVPSGQPLYVTGPPFGERWSRGLYVGVVSVTVPAAARDLELAPGTIVVQGRDGPARVAAFEVQVPAGGQIEHVIRFTLPRGHRRVVVEPSGRVPPTAWRYGEKVWEDSARRVANL